MLNQCTLNLLTYRFDKEGPFPLGVPMVAAEDELEMTFRLRDSPAGVITLASTAKRLKGRVINSDS